MLIGERYLIRFKLGEDGIGQVCLTEDQELEGAIRAIKLLPDKLTEDIKAVKRFEGRSPDNDGIESWQHRSAT